MKKTYIYEMDGKVTHFSNEDTNSIIHDIMEVQGVPFDNDTIDILNNILLNGCYREKTILQDFGGIEKPQTPYGDNVINVYDKQGNGFQVFIRSAGGHSKGAITG